MSLGNLGAKWAARWTVLNAMATTSAISTSTFRKPVLRVGKEAVVVLMQTDMGRGFDFMEGTHKWHGVAPNDDQLVSASNS